MTAAEIIKLASEKGWGFTGVYLTKNGMSILPEDWWAEGRRRIHRKNKI